MTTTVRPKSGFFIGVGCPGCGGPLEIERDFFVTTCEHCGSIIRIVMPDTPAAFVMPGRVDERELRFHIDRHLKERHQPLTATRPTVKKLYYPYWKIDASLLKLRNKTETRVIPAENENDVDRTFERDVSAVSVNPYHLTIAAGPRMEGIPGTLGIRAQTMQVEPFSHSHVEADYDALPVMRTWQAVHGQLVNAVDALSQISPADFGANLTRMFNPVFSLVFAPYVIAECYGESYRRFVVDGLSGRVLDVIEPESRRHAEGGGDGDAGGVYSADDALAKGVSRRLLDDDADSGAEENPPDIEFGQLGVEFHRCHNCGDDLPPQLSYVYVCRNCRHVQMLGPGGRSLPDIKFVRADTDRNVKLVPFWWLRLPRIMTGPFGNLLGGVDHSDCMFVPALRSGNFEAVCRLTRRMSAAQGRMPTDTIDELDDRCLAVRIGLAEAVALAEVVVYRELLEHGHRLPEEEIVIKPDEVGLTFVPFHLENYFYVDSVLNAIGVEKTVID